jgi:hypothetical protein
VAFAVTLFAALVSPSVGAAQPPADASPAASPAPEHDAPSVPPPAAGPGASPLAPAPAPDEPRQSLGTAIDVDPGATCLSADILIRRIERWLEKSKVDARIRVHVQGDRSAADRVSFVIDRGDGSRA